MTPIVQFLKVFASMLKSGKMSYSDALTRFRAQFARPAGGVEKAAIMKEVEKAPSNVFQFPKDRITNPFEPRPEVTKKVDEDSYIALLDRQSKETKAITPEKYPGMSWYSAMGKNLAKHRREGLEFKYHEMSYKIIEKARRIEADPPVLMEAELGTKLTGKETTFFRLDTPRR